MAALCRLRRTRLKDRGVLRKCAPEVTKSSTMIFMSDHVASLPFGFIDDAARLDGGDVAQVIAASRTHQATSTEDDNGASPSTQGSSAVSIAAELATEASSNALWRPFNALAVNDLLKPSEKLNMIDHIQAGR
jgi:hypothetical protein